LRSLREVVDPVSIMYIATKTGRTKLMEDKLDGVWVALGIIVSASVFSTGFLSVRVHTVLDRTIDNLVATDERIRDRPPDQGMDANLKRALLSFASVIRLDTVNQVTALANVVLLLAVLLLCRVVWVKSNWHWVSDWAAVAGNYWALCTIVVVEVSVVVIGVLETRNSARHAQSFREDFLAIKLHEAEKAFSNALGQSDRKKMASGLERAMTLYYELGSEVPQWSYVYQQAGIAARRVLILATLPGARRYPHIVLRACFEHLRRLEPSNWPWQLEYSQALLWTPHIATVPSVLAEAKQELWAIAEHAPDTRNKHIAKNNLAAIAILEKDYATAQANLESICRDGEVCAEVCHNLSVVHKALQNLGEADTFHQLREYLAPNYSEMDNEDRQRGRPLAWWRRAAIVNSQPTMVDGEGIFYFSEPDAPERRWHRVPDPLQPPIAWLNALQNQGP
jgi:hypothetical protein